MLEDLDALLVAVDELIAAYENEIDWDSLDELIANLQKARQALSYPDED